MMHDQLVADRPTEEPEDRSAKNLESSPSRWPSTRTTFIAVLGAYIALTAAVVLGSPLDVIDRAAAMSDLAHRFPDAAPWVLHYVVLGQRGPSSHVAFVYLAWRAVRQRSWRPLVLLVTALTMLNLTVGTVKIAIGRLGPALTMHPRAVFDGGDIFPSGHTSNAVVIFGVVAMVAVEHRKAMVALAVTVATTVGLSTIFLDTHWVTDVLGGWFAGALVLLALPMTYARLEQLALRMTRTVKQWFRPRPRPATWESVQHDVTSDLFTEDAMSR
jgi:membrane-associated phospholipid phosphatase